MRRSGFTLIELIFVIVIIGILAAVAIPKFKYLKQNAYISNVIAAISDINGSGGASSYLNATELNEVNESDLNITDLYKFQGKDWNISADNKTAYFRKGYTDFNATFTYGNGDVNITIGCGSVYKPIVEKKGYKCNTTYTVHLNTQE